MNDQDVAWRIAQHLSQLRKTPRPSISAPEYDEVCASLSRGSKYVFVRRALRHVDVDQRRHCPTVDPLTNLVNDLRDERELVCRTVG